MLGDALQLAGMAAITVGCFLLAPWLGLIAGGVLLTVVGLSMERGRDA